MKRAVSRAVTGVLIAVAAVYAADWAFFELRLARGTAMGSVVVERYLKMPLKGNKEAFDYLGTAEENCARTLLPQYAASAWNPPCWWLAGHRTRWQSVTLPLRYRWSAASAFAAGHPGEWPGAARRSDAENAIPGDISVIRRVSGT